MIPSLYGKPTSGSAPAPDMVRRLFTGTPTSPTQSPYSPAPTSPTAYAPARSSMPAPTPYGTQSAPAPAPMVSGTGPTQGAISSFRQTAMQPQGGFGGGVPGMFPGAAPKPAPYNPYGDLDPGHQEELERYFRSLAGIDYKGSRESAQLQQKMLGDLFRQWEGEGPVDYTSAAPVADQFAHSRDAMNASLAARGLNGGVVAGANSASYGDESKAIGEYIRQLLQDRQHQHHDDMQQFNQWARGLNSMGLQQNMNEQNSGGFWDDLAGVGGSLIGGALGGPIGVGIGGAIGKKIGGKP